MPTKIKSQDNNTNTEPAKFCQGKCQHEFKQDENGRPYVKCHGCGREIGKRD